MARELFLMPLVGTGGPDDPIRGKYTNFDFPQLERTAIIPYHPDTALAYVQAAQADLNAIAQQSDTLRLASVETIDARVTQSEADFAKTEFEALNIPAQFIEFDATRRQVIRQLIGLFLFIQRLRGLYGVHLKQRMTEFGLSLNSTWAELPVSLRNELRAVASSFGWDANALGVNSASTLREILHIMTQQFGQEEFRLAGHSI